jgi:flagellar protein FliJ
MEAQHFSRAVNHFVAEQTRHKQSHIELVSRELSLRLAKLDNEIAAEEARTGIINPTHFAYPLYAKAVAQRRDNLLRTIAELKRQSDSWKIGVGMTRSSFDVAPTC